MGESGRGRKGENRSAQRKERDVDERGSETARMEEESEMNKRGRWIPLHEVGKIMQGGRNGDTLRMLTENKADGNVSGSCRVQR